MTTEALKSLGATLNFIEIWLKRLNHNYEVRCGIYNKAMKQMIKQISKKMTKPLGKNKTF